MELHYKVFSSIDLTSTIRAQLSSIIASSFPPENNQLPQFNAHINGSHSSILVAFSDFNEPVGLICFQKRNSTLFGLSFPFYVAGPIATHSSFSDVVFARLCLTFLHLSQDELLSVLFASQEYLTFILSTDIFHFLTNQKLSYQAMSSHTHRSISCQCFYRAILNHTIIFAKILIWK